jgi:hypothetical protein
MVSISSEDTGVSTGRRSTRAHPADTEDPVSTQAATQPLSLTTEINAAAAAAAAAPQEKESQRKKRLGTVGRK